MREDSRTSVEEIEGWEAGIADAVLRECLRTFPHLRIRATGTCMRPDLHPGDIVSIASPSRRPPRWGDIVLVRNRNGLRLHRLVWRWPFASDRFPWLTKADRSVECDPRVSPADLLGTVVRIEGPTLARRTGNTRFQKTVQSLVTGLIAWARAGLRRSPGVSAGRNPPARPANRPRPSVAGRFS